jgi:hypothetical protein
MVLYLALRIVRDAARGPASAAGPSTEPAR